MTSRPRTTPSRQATTAFVMLVVLSILISMGMILAPTHQQHLKSIFDLGYLVGPTTHSLIDGHGLLVCTDRMGTPGKLLCFHSARMPVASTVLAAEVGLLGDRPRIVDVVKTLLFLLPLWLAMWLVLRRAARDQITTLGSAVLLLLPFFVVNLLVVVISMEVEEGYLYGLLALALTVLLYPMQRNLRWTIGFALLLMAIFICKSSMLPLVAVLLVIGLVAMPSWKLRGLAVLLVTLAPVSWAMYQHHAGGRYTLGTSLDGLNLHKGNNAKFQDRYPTSNSKFDSYDPEFDVGQHFQGEWSYNDYHLAYGKNFAISHPGYTAGSFLKKATYLYLSFQPYTATKMSPALRSIGIAGVILFRLLLWTALGLAVYGAVTTRGVGRAAGLIFLCFVGAYSVPYLVGFGFMRHAVMLAYPSAILCCFALAAARGGLAQTGSRRL